MRWSRVAFGAVLLAGLVVATQLAFTTVGEEVGGHWTEPAELAAVESDTNTLIAEVAADGGPSGGAAAWIERDGENWRVRAARLTVRDGNVSVGRVRTVARSSRALLGVDTAVRNGTLVVTWEIAVEDDVVLARVGPQEVRRRVVSADPFRAHGTSVDLTGGGAVVGYTAVDDAEDDFDVRLAYVPGANPDANVTHATVGGPTHVAHVPSVSTADDRVAVTWFQRAADTAMVTTGRTGSSVQLGPTTTLGEARIQGSFGGTTRDVPFVTGARTVAAARPVWTDIGAVTTTTVTDDGAVGDRRVLATGGAPGVAARDDRWLVTWVVTRRATSGDVQFHHSDGTTGDLAQFPSTAREPAPVFAPETGVVWLEWGSQSRVLASAYRPTPQGGPVDRLRAAPQRFAFISLAAVAVGAATVPVMPWSFVGVFGAFVLTTGVVSSPFMGAGARLAGLFGHETSKNELRNRLRDAPAIVWTALFAIPETAFARYVIANIGELPSIGFGHAAGASAFALAAAVVAMLAADIDSNWRGIVVFVYFQNAALWAIAATSFL